MKKILRVSAVILLMNLSAGAIYGSLIFLSDPGGGKFFLSVDLLSRSPFKTYLIPGMILLIVNGLFPLFVIYTILVNKSYFKWFLVLQGCMLWGWLSIQLLINTKFFFSPMHFMCYATGMLLILTGLLLMKPDQVSFRKKAPGIKH